jgi:hypothetical protein
MQLPSPAMHAHAPPPVLTLSYRLLGGGGDGGSTGAESRSCYLEMYAGRKNDKVNPLEELHAKWTRCHLSGELLSPPVVVDELGNVFNKDAVVNALLHKTMPAPLAYISGLKHLTEVKLERNASSSAGGGGPVENGAATGPSNDAQFCCPVTGVAWNGRYKFVVFKASGLAVSGPPPSSGNPPNPEPAKSPTHPPTQHTLSCLRATGNTRMHMCFKRADFNLPPTSPTPPYPPLPSPPNLFPAN